ncbi:MAG: hypothetical protein ACU0B9_18975 [Limimaricola soesokkakensis]|uniref:hypothetical protein n=1 Tax=Limimaricola soesokkakensis TaxID=1343159 RepID=UPI00405A1AA7
MEWLSSNSAALGWIVKTGMLVGWIVYLTIFLVSYLRQRRQCILIAQGAGPGCPPGTPGASSPISGSNRSTSWRC